MHEPVLVEEIIGCLEPKPGDVVVDGTANGGGHMRAILPHIFPGGKYVAVDWDKKIVDKLSDEFQKSEYWPNIIFVNDNYKNIPMILRSHSINAADKALLDLGFSSFHIEESGRGFSFQKDEPLEMTYSKDERPLHEWLKHLSETRLAEIIREFGEERYAGRIARAIKSALPIETSGKLAEVIVRAVPRNYERGRINPATRTFQALRIFANKEMENLEIFLKALPEILNNGGRAAIITFHSLEDRLVKIAFRNLISAPQPSSGSSTKTAFRLVTKKPVVSSESEIVRNPRARSAKLRVIEKLA